MKSGLSLFSPSFMCIVTHVPIFSTSIDVKSPLLSRQPRLLLAPYTSVYPCARGFCYDMMIEVERKFLLIPDTRNRLSSLGAHLTVKKHLHDVYYDTADHEMIMRDFWLRRREGRWELKWRDLHEEEGGGSVAILPEDRGVLCATDQYKEEDEEGSILDHLEKIFRLRTRATNLTSSTAVTMDTVLECGVLVEVVEVNCIRESYLMRGGGSGEWTEVKVDLDECELKGEGGEGGGGRYGVGEVEIIVSSPTVVEPAALRCRDLAALLGQNPYPKLLYPLPSQEYVHQLHQEGRYHSV